MFDNNFKKLLEASYNRLQEQKARYGNILEGEGGGKGGGGSGGVNEATDTLHTNEIIKTLHLLGEGVCQPYYGTSDTQIGQSIFLNNIPVINQAGQYNFPKAAVEFRSGTTSQPLLSTSTFPAGTPSIYQVGAEIKGGDTASTYTVRGVVYNTAGNSAVPALYSVTSANIDYCKVAITFPEGLVTTDGAGNINGDTVQFAIDTKLHSTSTWTLNVVGPFSVTDKSTGPATLQYKVPRPTSAGLWDLRIRRLTPNTYSVLRKNQTSLLDVEEVQNISLPYDGVCYAGVALDASALGLTSTAIPSISFLLQGVSVKIPSNYNPVTRNYTGAWNGTFTTGVTDNPAWILYDMITNTNYGGGLYGVTDDSAPAPHTSMIDKFSFYNAALFCDGVDGSGNFVGVSDGQGGHEPRFTFNAPIQNRKDLLQTLQEVAGMMNAVIGVVNGLITVFQDRPTDTMYPINKSNVIGSSDQSPVYFTYKSSALTSRTTAVVCTWTNATDLRYLPTTTSEVDANAIARYGYLSYDLAAYGATSEGQAKRAARWWLYTNQNQSETVEFKTGLAGFNMALYDVFDLYDEDYTGQAGSGRIVSATSNTVTLDQPVVVSGTSPKISVLLQDGVTYETHAITSALGTTANITISGTWSTTPTKYCPYIVTSAIAPRTFRVIDIKIDGVTKEVTVTAQLYNKGNYSWIENGVVLPAKVYSTPVSNTVADVTNIVFAPNQYFNPVDNHLQRGLSVSWTPPVGVQVTGYIVKWRKDGGTYKTEQKQAGTQFEIEAALPGYYEVIVYATNLVNSTSGGAAASYTYDITGGGSAVQANDVYGLTITGTTGGTQFSGQDLSFTWTNPAENNGLVKGFLVTLTNGIGGAQLRAPIVVPGVAGGSTQSFIYTYGMNLQDGGPNRSIHAVVQCIDNQNNYTPGTSSGAYATFTNPAPGAVGGITSSTITNAASIFWTNPTDTDYAGTIVWLSTSSTFTPSAANKLFSGPSSMCSIAGLQKATTYYYYVAAYDTFESAAGIETGATLNLSGQYSFATTAAVGTPSGSTLPTSGMATGDVFYLTTNHQLYTYNGSAWVIVGIISGSTLPGSGDYTGELFYNNTNAKLYRWSGSAWLKAVDGADITAGTVTANQIAAGTITGSLIAAGTVQASNIQAGTITASQLAAGSVTATQIGTNAITIYDGSGNALFGVGHPLNLSSAFATNPPTGWLNNQISLNANGTINNAGGGQVTVGGIGAVSQTDSSTWPSALNNGTVSLGYNSTTGSIYLQSAGGGSVAGVIMPGYQINATNISTYIAGAAIDTAYIRNLAVTQALIANGAIGTLQVQDLAVTGAKIANLAVDTLQIANQAVTIPLSSVCSTPPQTAIVASWTNAAPSLLVTPASITVNIITLPPMVVGVTTPVTLIINFQGARPSAKNFASVTSATGIASIQLKRNGAVLNSADYTWVWGTTGSTTRVGNHVYYTITPNGPVAMPPYVYTFIDYAPAGTNVYTLDVVTIVNTGTSKGPPATFPSPQFFTYLYDDTALIALVTKK